MTRFAWFALAGFAILLLAAPLSIAEDVLSASVQSDELAPLGIPEGQQQHDVDTGSLAPGAAAMHVTVTVSEGKRGLNAVNVKRA